MFLISRKSIKYHGEREIRILKLLSKHMGDQSCAMKYLEVLLSFLDKNVKDSGMVSYTLITFFWIKLQYHVSCM